ncbi:MAG: YiiX family permuted papain-like enzyme, partial [Holophaga sp.]|nr:YiiX family permuted papain-like enzyme [Holophaga sp.]
WTRIKQRLALGCLLAVASGCFGQGLNGDRMGLKEGDVLFQTSRSAQSQAIQIATHSRWSHMGMLARENGRWMVFEAVQPVRLTPLNEWVRRGQGGHVVVKRLKDAAKRLDEKNLSRMRQVGRRLLGKPYDLTFEWDDRRIYCSELVWKIYKEGAGIELGHLQRLQDFDLSHPAVQKKMRERYGNKLPLEEPVISPQAMFESPLLATVFER